MMLNVIKDSLRLRTFSEKDIDFLKKVYFSTRDEEMNQVVFWTTDIKKAFLTQQFDAQHDYYQKNYVGAKFWVIENENKSIGRLYYDDNFEGNIRIIDISLLPEYQKKGFGTSLLKSILERGKAVEKNVTIHVESFNPAMALYKKLGFQKISETNGVYHLLEWNYKN